MAMRRDIREMTESAILNASKIFEECELSSIRIDAVVFVCRRDPVNSATLKTAWKAQRSQVLDGLTSF